MKAQGQACQVGRPSGSTHGPAGAYVLSGEAVLHYGNHLEKSVVVKTGEQVFVAADIPHAPRNESDSDCVLAVVHASRSDLDGIVMLPELDAQLAARG